MTFTTQTCTYDTAFGADSPFYRSTCRACSLRAMAMSPLYHSSMRLGMLVPSYTKSLKATFPGEDVATVHAEVRAVAERISNAKAEVL